MLELWTIHSLPQSVTFLYPGQRPAECELGEWSQWVSCMKKNKTCGFKKGSQSRVRVPLPQIHSPDTSPAFVPSQTCVPQTERRKCIVTKTPCVRGNAHKVQKTHTYGTLIVVMIRWYYSDYRWTNNKVHVLHEMPLPVNMMTDRTITQHPKVLFPPVCLWPAACWLGLVWLSSQKDTESLDFSACKQ